MKKIKVKLERCVLCHKATIYDRDYPIQGRLYYIECVGQLCQDCYNEFRSKLKF